MKGGITPATSPARLWAAGFSAVCGIAAAAVAFCAPIGCCHPVPLTATGLLVLSQAILSVPHRVKPYGAREPAWELSPAQAEVIAAQHRRSIQ